MLYFLLFPLFLLAALALHPLLHLRLLREVRRHPCLHLLHLRDAAEVVRRALDANVADAQPLFNERLLDQNVLRGYAADLVGVRATQIRHNPRAVQVRRGLRSSRGK